MSKYEDPALTTLMDQVDTLARGKIVNGRLVTKFNPRPSSRSDVRSPEPLAGSNLSNLGTDDDQVFMRPRSTSFDYTTTLSPIPDTRNELDTITSSASTTDDSSITASSSPATSTDQSDDLSMDPLQIYTVSRQIYTVSNISPSTSDSSLTGGSSTDSDDGSLTGTDDDLPTASTSDLTSESSAAEPSVVTSSTTTDREVDELEDIYTNSSTNSLGETNLVDTALVIEEDEEQPTPRDPSCPSEEQFASIKEEHRLLVTKPLAEGETPRDEWTYGDQPWSFSNTSVTYHSTIPTTTLPAELTGNVVSSETQDDI